MNPYVIRDNLLNKKGSRVKIRVNGMRNKTDTYMGILKDIYPQIFTVETSSGIKSFSYSEIINKDVTITFV